MKLSPHRLTHGLTVLAFAVWLGLVTSTWPLAHPELYLQHAPHVAAPQCISGRTSYLHVRLAFHPYPQLISQFCNTGECEPRRPVRAASLWPWIAHVVSGRIAATAHALHARFPSGSPALPLVNQATTMHSPDHSTKGTPSALTPSRESDLWLLVSPRFQGLFHPPRGVLFTFPSRYWFTIGH